jgi:alpha-galactosidase
MKRTIILLSALINGMFVFNQTATKLYLANENELAFPKEFSKLCFGIESDMPGIYQIKQGWGKVMLAKSVAGDTIRLGSDKFVHGLGVHANSELIIELPDKAKSFSAVIGYQNNEMIRKHATSKLIFSIEDVLGKTIWKSEPLSVTDKPVKINLPLNGTRKFKLKIESVDNVIEYTHCNWGNADVTLQNGKKIFLDELIRRNSLISSLPFSFSLDDKSSRDFLSSWFAIYSDSIAKDKIYHTIKWTKPDASFEVRCCLAEFTTHSAVEWKLYFKNKGNKNSPVLQNVWVLDATLSGSEKSDGSLAEMFQVTEPVRIHYVRGTDATIYDYQPNTVNLRTNEPFIMETRGGRSSDRFLPFWNVEYRGKGLVTAMGWSGDWKAEYNYYSEGSRVSMKAGMKNLSTYLKPSEEISSPTICLLYWEGDEAWRGNNLFRRYMRDQWLPKWYGKEPMIYAQSGGANRLEDKNESNQLDYIKKIAGTGANLYWLDAGWYQEGVLSDNWWDARGNWFPDKKKFPNGMKIISDAAHKNGMKFLLWFDPECVSPQTEIANKYPQWVIRKSPDGYGILNYGNPDALKYITDLISSELKDWDVDIFRNDFNIDPDSFWKLADEPGRRGITEIRCIEGLYKFWDELLKRKPGMLIDNCAAGGRRIDYETCKRSVALTRTDYITNDFVADQNHTYGLSSYVLINGTGYGMTFNKYQDRSVVTASVGYGFVPDKNGITHVPADSAKKVYDEIKSYNYLFLGDYYPLTDYSLSDKVWMVLQFDQPEKGEGCALFFRRANAPFAEGEFDLKALDPQSTYKLTFIDTGKEITGKGDQVKKVSVKLNKEESAVVKYMRQ